MTNPSPPRTRAPGGGRKALYDTPMKAVNIPVTEQQREKLRRLGGAAWIRQQIDAAPEPEHTTQIGPSA